METIHISTPDVSAAVLPSGWSGDRRLVLGAVSVGFAHYAHGGVGCLSAFASGQRASAPPAGTSSVARARADEARIQMPGTSQVAKTMTAGHVESPATDNVQPMTALRHREVPALT